MWKQFNSQRIFLVYKHGRRFIVLYTNMAAVTSCENDVLSLKFQAHTQSSRVTLNETKPLSFCFSLIIICQGFKVKLKIRDLAYLRQRGI